jgi:hypothetical protein
VPRASYTARRMDQSSPKWNGYGEHGWEQQRWFGDTDDNGQPITDPSHQVGAPAFEFSDVDGMFAHGGFQNRCLVFCMSSRPFIAAQPMILRTPSQLRQIPVPSNLVALRCRVGWKWNTRIPKHAELTSGSGKQVTVV